MSEIELARAFRNGEISRRSLIRQLVGSGLSVVAASAFADALVAPTAASAATEKHSKKPKVLAVTPDSGPTTGGTKVAVVGHHLEGALVVSFGQREAKIIHSSPSEVHVKTPKGPRGHVDVTVTTKHGTSANSKAARFTYTHHAAPSVVDLDPNGGSSDGGTSVTIEGDHLRGVTAVHFGSRKATNIRVIDTTKITCLSPMGSGEVHVTVTTKYGKSHRNADSEYRYLGSAPTPTPTPTPTPFPPTPFAVTGSEADGQGRLSAAEAKQRRAAAIRERVSPLSPPRRRDS